MRTTRLAIAMAGLGLAAAMAASPSMEPAAEPEHGSRKNKPSGNTPVPGGGARERERRLARMKTGDVDADTGCADDKLPGTADDWRKPLQPKK